MKKLIFLVFCLSTGVLAQSGGAFTITKSVIAGGGGQNATGGTFSLDGTIGQAVAGTSSSGGTYSLRGGFWTPQAFTPTAASASISGQIRTADGRGIRNVRWSDTSYR